MLWTWDQLLTAIHRQEVPIICSHERDSALFVSAVLFIDQASTYPLQLTPFVTRCSQCHQTNNSEASWCQQCPQRLDLCALHCVSGAFHLDGVGSWITRTPPEDPVPWWQSLLHVCHLHDTISSIQHTVSRYQTLTLRLPNLFLNFSTPCM
jgi:hypothetical protein